VKGNPHASGELPSPPRPPSGLPKQPPGYHAPARSAQDIVNEGQQNLAEGYTFVSAQTLLADNG